MSAGLFEPISLKNLVPRFRGDERIQDVTTDPFTPHQRSAVMRAVPGKNSSAELKVRKALTQLGARYRLHRRDLPGSPDIVLPGRRLAIFVHGCFWHGHACRRGARTPKANAAYWTAKIGRNMARDGAAQAALTAAGWRVEVVWECELRDAEVLGARLAGVIGVAADVDVPPCSGASRDAGALRS